MRNYTTVSMRRIGSSDLLKKIDSYYEDVEKLDKRASSALSNLYDENYDDAKYREDCLINAGQIYNAYSEGKSLAGFTINWNNPASKWITTSSYNLTNYTKGITEIRDLQNNLYTESYKDMFKIWEMFRPYSADVNRNILLNCSDIYDDTYIRTRHVLKYSSKQVMKDASLSKSWGNYYLNKEYSNVTEIEDEYDTTPEPTLPAVSKFKGLISYGDGSDNALYYAKKIVALPLSSRTNKAWFQYVKFNATTINSIMDITIYDTNKTENFADTVISDLEENLLFTTTDDEYAYFEVLTKEKQIFKVGDFYTQYQTYYNDSTTSVKSLVYNSYPKIYKDNEYCVKIRLSLIYYYKADNTSKTFNLTNSASNTIAKLLTKGLAEKLTNYLSSSSYVYKKAETASRCEDYQPEETYNDYIKKLGVQELYSTDYGCKLAQKYCVSLIDWINKRKKSLMAQTTDEIAINNLLTALSMRLNKDTGTLMMWYQNLVGIDPEFKNIIKKKNSVIYSMKGLLVARAVDESDETTFAHQITPNYIDIEATDALYSQYKYSFNKGDVIYIEDDTHTEIKTKITNISNVTIKTTNYTDLDIESLNSGNLDGELTKNKTVKRLYLTTRLPIYYCNDNDVSDLRVMKII